MLEYPPDGGWGWVIVISSLVNNFVLDGVAFSYGVLTDEIKKSSAGEVDEFWFHLCGSAMLGLTLLCGPVVSVLIPRFGYRNISIAGSLISCLGFILSWASSPNTPNFYSLFFGFGILGGIGFGLMFTTSIVIVGLYFDQNRPLATGTATAGSAVGSIVLPYLILQTTQAWGWQGSLLTLAGLCLTSGVFGFLYRPLPKKLVKVSKFETGLKGKEETAKEQILKLLSSPTYILLSFSGLLTVLGYFVPSAFLTDKAEKDFNATRDDATYLPMIIGASNTVGRVIFGLLANSERASYSLLITNVALTVGGIATVLSAYATHYYQLILYSILFGQILAVYGSLRSIVIMEFVGDERFNVGFGLSLFFMGISALFGNTLAGLLVKTTDGFTVSFVVTGGLILISGFMGYPLRYINTLEKRSLRRSSRVHRPSILQNLS